MMIKFQNITFIGMKSQPIRTATHHARILSAGFSLELKKKKLGWFEYEPRTSSYLKLLQLMTQGFFVLLLMLFFFIFCYCLFQ